MLSNVNKSLRLAEAAEGEDMEHQIAWKKSKEEKKKNGKIIKNVPAAKKVALESAPKVADAYDARLFKLKEKL